MSAVGTAATQGKGQSQHQGHRAKEEVILIIVIFSSYCCDCRELIFLLTNIRRSLPLLLLPSPLLLSLLLLLYSRKRVYVYWLDAELIELIISKYKHMLIKKLFLYKKNQSIYHRSDNNILYCIVKLSGDYFIRKRTTSNIILLYGCSHYSVGKFVARKVNSSLQTALRAHNMRAQHYSRVDFEIVILS